MPNKALKILLINLPNSGSFSGFAGATYLPLGIAYIASVLRESGHNVKVADLQAEQALGNLNDFYIHNILSGYDYDLLGIGGVFFFLSWRNLPVGNSPSLTSILGDSRWLYYFKDWLRTSLRTGTTQPMKKP